MPPLLEEDVAGDGTVDVAAQRPRRRRASAGRSRPSRSCRRDAACEPKKRPSGKPNPIQPIAGWARSSDRNRNSRLTSSSALDRPLEEDRANDLGGAFDQRKRRGQVVANRAGRSCASSAGDDLLDVAGRGALPDHVHERRRSTARPAAAAPSPRGRAARAVRQASALPTAFGDEARATIECRIGPGPIQEDDEAVAEADQEPQMREAPEQPGRKPVSANAAEIGDRRLAADRGEIAEIRVAEGRRSAIRRAAP